MDLPSKNMYDTFKDEILKELGPLDPGWFEALTAQTFTNEENVSDQDDLCANQEGNFKTPFDKSGVESQLFSTPKVFRRSRVVSPETEDEQSFTAEQGKETLPWTATQSPYLFQMSKEGVPEGIQPLNDNSFELLHTPQKISVNYANHISESLGAQLHPDISWTSSLNTPPASTLILTKPEESPCPGSVSAEKNVVFVRKLFPSLSNASRVGAVLPKNNDMHAIHQGVVSPVAGQGPESHNSPQSNGVWRPNLPDAIEDGEIRSTVATVLDGAEDVLSIFFTNSSSALRKVKTERIKRKQIIPTKEHGCSSEDFSTTNNTTSSEQRAADQESDRLASPPLVKTGDIGITQWSPLSLSEIPTCTVDTSCCDNSPFTQKNTLTEQPRSDIYSGQVVRPTINITNSGFTKKKRKFVYTVGTSKSQVQGQDTQTRKMDSLSGNTDSGQQMKQLVKAPDEEIHIGKNEMEKKGNLAKENLLSPAQAKAQDLDISQLSRDFAQDFSQMSDPIKLSTLAEDTPQIDFNPSACLSAMKEANQKARQANLQHDCHGVGYRRYVSTTYQNNSISEGTVTDSGFQTAVADVSHETASSFVLPISENISQSEHQIQWTGFKTDIYRTAPFPSTNKRNGKAHLEDISQEPETDANLSLTQGTGRESELCMESTSIQLPSSAKRSIDHINGVPLNGPVHGTVPQKTTVSLSSVHASGFKTASNKGMQILSANLERAKRLLEETENERTAHGPKDECSMSHGLVKSTTSNSDQLLSSNEKNINNSFQLTASQKADVTELCTLLEEADSQFEFTQFKTAKPKQSGQDNATSSQKVDKELDPDFLTGIDFDDSFNSDPEKHPAVTVMHDKMNGSSDGTTHCETSTVTSKSTALSLLSTAKKENSSTKDVSSSSKHITKGTSDSLSDETKNLDSAGHTEMSKLENKNPLMLGVGFKTAGGNVLRVSKKCLSKARALFADLEESPVTSERYSNKKSNETVAQKQQKRSGDNRTGNFLQCKEDRGNITCSDREATGIGDKDASIASVKGISFTANSMKKEDAFFKDCNVKDSDADMSLKHKKTKETLCGSVSHRKSLQKFKNVQGMQANLFEEPINKFEKVNAGAAACHTEVVQHNEEVLNFGCKKTSALTNTASFHEKPSSTAKAISSLSDTKPKNIGSSAINKLSSGGGFCTASGAKVFVSADAMRKAECLLNDIDTSEGTNKQLKQKENAVTGHLSSHIQVPPPKNGGFQTASGKSVVISAAALKKAKSLLSECEEVEDVIGIQPTHSQLPVPGPPPRNSGFLPTSGKPVAFSSEALLKAKALFSDIGLSAEIPTTSNTRNSDKKQDNAENTEKIQCGLSTAGGAKGHVPQKNLLKTKNLLTEIDDESISPTAMKEADAFFSDCDMDSEDVITSKAADCSSFNELSNSGGFCTASGKKVSVSDDAMTKAKSLLHESAAFEDTNKQLKQNVVLPQNSGFQTASGKGVAVSSAALKKAKRLLSGCGEVEDEVSLKPAHSKMPVPGPPPRNHGFLAASGKPVAFSSEALQKAKALFSDISFNAEIPAVFHTRNIDKKQDDVENIEKIQCGFSTAGGAKVHVSQKNLLKAKNQLKEIDDGSVSPTAMREADAFFSDCDIMDSEGGMSVKHRKSTAPVIGSGNEKKNLRKFPDQRLINISEQTGRGHTDFENNGKMLHSYDVEIPKGVNMLDSTNAPSLHGNPSLMAKPALLCTTSKNVSCSAISEISNGSGFCTASGKKVSVSDEAMTKAKSLLNESAAFEDTNKQLKQNVVLPQNSGFQTASGKGVAVSTAALTKAKRLLSGCGEVEDEVSLKPTHSKTPGPGPPPRNHGFLAASGKPVAFSSETLQKAKALFSDISFNAESPAVSDTRNSDKKQDDVENLVKIQCGFSTAGGKKVQISQKNLLNAKHLLKELDDESISATAMKEADTFFKGCDIMDSEDVTTSKAADCSSFSELSNSDRFCTANRKKVAISDEAMPKAKSLLNENATFEGINKQLKQKVDTLPPQNSGFQTASGKGVAVSSAALKKAKSLLSECQDVVDEISVKLTHSTMAVPGPPPRSHGFLAASGRPVALSSEALQKAKALFSDICTEIPAVSHTRNSEHKDAQNHTEKMHCVFSTAGGAKVNVSQKNLLKAKNLLNDFAHGECCDSSSTLPRQHDTQKSDLSEVTNSNLTTARDKDRPIKESASHLVKSLTSLYTTDNKNETLRNANAHGSTFIKDKAPTDSFQFKEGKNTQSVVRNPNDSLTGEMPSVLDHETYQTSSNEGFNVMGTEVSSVLYFHPLNLSGCTKTQQKLLAQEALDCTKALLEDENLAGQRLLMTLDNVPVQDVPEPHNRSVEGEKGKGKRLVADPDMTGQPPLKRRLLGEFDRTVDGARGPTLHPEISTPNGVMKERGVFKYSMSLHPNITHPHRNGKNYVETKLKTTTQHSAQGDDRSAHSKVFVPPFLKNAKTESHKHTVLKDNTRTPSVFVPPFKKQRTVVQEISSKPQEEGDKLHLFVPPTEKLQSTTNGPGYTNKEDNQSMALADATNDNLINNQNLPVGRGSEDSAPVTLHAEDTLSRSQDMLQNMDNVELARDMQDMRLRKKKRENIRPLPGSLFLTKTSGVSRIPLKAALNGKPPARYTQKQLYSLGVHRHVYEIASETAESFRFNLKQFVKQEAFIDEGGVQLADGGWLIPSNDGTAGKQEFYRALCDTPGVDPKLISEEWVYNHYRWIVWKQASMERSFPETMGSLRLTPEQVLLQLKYRYDVEVDHSRRPALRKIMEKDDTAAKTLVLCVCGVVSRGHSQKRQSDIKTPGADAKVEITSAVVWLTDGWYAIKAQLDEPLTAMLHKGRLAVGGKLIINGAQLVGSQDACSPLEAPESLMLKICANSSRLARWDAKLGFHRDPRPFLLPVSCLYSNGGPVGCVDIIILRSYPIQWMERKPDGGVVFRSVRAEEKEARRYNSHKQKAMEILFAKIQAEFEKEEKGNNKPQRRRWTVSHQDIASLQDGEELYEAVGDDPTYLETHLSEQQLETLRSYRRSQMEKKQAELQDRYRRAIETAEDSEGSCPKRDVTPVWRLCIADSTERPGSVYQLNLWRPPSDLQSLLKEGGRYKVYNVTTSEGKKHGGNTTVQLTGTKKTQFQDLQASQEWLSTRFQPRVSAHFVDLQIPEFQPLCGEVDLTGYVISIIDGQGLSPAFYLADGKLNFIKVRCFSSLAQSGLEDVVKPRILLALSNLQLRGQSTSPTPVVYAGDLTVFSTNPKEVHLQESFGQLRNSVQAQENFFLTAEEKLSHLLKSDGQSSMSSPALHTRTPAFTTGRRQDTKTTQPVRSFGSFTPVSRNPAETNRSTEKDPVSLKRKRALDYLSRIPSPPPLSHLGSVASPCVNKTFNPPRRSGTPSTLKTVQTPARKPVSSPVEDEWVNDEELAMIDTQALLVGDLM